jgi:hypothetical protein
MHLFRDRGNPKFKKKSGHQFSECSDNNGKLEVEKLL